jgi:peptide/nickel transport system permease protein
MTSLSLPNDAAAQVQPLPAQRSRGYWASVLQRLLHDPVAMGAAAVSCCW